MSNSVNEINEMLLKAYEKYFVNLSRKIIIDDNLSVPMTIKLDDSYYDSTKPTIMVYGKETNYFGNENCRLFKDIDISSFSNFSSSIKGATNFL